MGLSRRQRAPGGLIAWPRAAQAAERVPWASSWGGRRFCAETWDISFIYFVRISDPARQNWETFIRILSPRQHTLTLIGDWSTRPRATFDDHAPPSLIQLSLSLKGCVWQAGAVVRSYCPSSHGKFRKVSLS
jgi:hypothetical protein